MSEADTPWARLACRVVRVAMARKEYSYPLLVKAYIANEPDETERGLVLRITRGTLRLSAFLHILTLMSATPPALWRPSLSSKAAWSEKARDVVLAELKRGQLTDYHEIVERLEKLGTTTTKEALEEHVTLGTIPLSLFLQLTFLVTSASLERYVDLADIAAAADISIV
ncbi:DUF6471 domain-containing protein [Caballeronia glebae]|uniref:DUF6471 domain-containing protein n=1 Tax=Caballeronia glebae TaxID=1777143 RepID=UPI0038BA712D